MNPTDIMNKLLKDYKSDGLDLMSKYDINLAIEIFENELKWLNQDKIKIVGKTNEMEYMIRQRIKDLQIAITDGKREIKL